MTYAVSGDGVIAWANDPDPTAGEIVFDFIAGSVGLVIGGDVSVFGTLAETLDNLTSVASGGGSVGTLARTLGDVTTAAAGTQGVPGTLARTLGSATVAASGTFIAAITGTAAATLANSTSAASGSSATGTVARTLDNSTCAATGTAFAATVDGGITETLDNATIAASGASGASGTSTVTLDNLTSASSGSSVSGAVARTLGNATPAATGTYIAPTGGDLARTLGDVTSSASGDVPGVVNGSFAATLDDLTSGASGDVIAPIEGTLNATLDGVTLSFVDTSVHVAADPSPVRCTARNQKFSRKFRYHRTAERPAIAVQVFDRRGQIIDFTDPTYSYLFRIGDPGDTAQLSKTTNIKGSATALTILWEPGELDIAPGRYDCQLIATSANNDLVVYGSVQIVDTIR